ncbi:hypothetical protein D3C81_169910 [compost metagenome]
MSGVDVLAVMDREVARAGGESYSDGRDLIEARAAFAELIEAGEEFAACDSLDAQKRFKAALSRVRGAA